MDDEGVHERLSRAVLRLKGLLFVNPEWVQHPEKGTFPNSIVRLMSLSYYVTTEMASLECTLKPFQRYINISGHNDVDIQFKVQTTPEILWAMMKNLFGGEAIADDSSQTVRIKLLNGDERESLVSNLQMVDQQVVAMLGELFHIQVAPLE